MKLDATLTPVPDCTTWSLVRLQAAYLATNAQLQQVRQELTESLAREKAAVRLLVIERQLREDAERELRELQPVIALQDEGALIGARA